MLLFLQADENVSWLAPYAYIIVLMGFAFFLFRVFENWYADHYDRPFYRHFFIFRRLSKEQLEIIQDEFHFYSLLSKREQREFQHRVSSFIKDKKFIPRGDLELTERMKVLISATGCMVSFGRKNYEYGLIEYILIYPDKFYSNMNERYHHGEFNPRDRCWGAAIQSWFDADTR